MSGGRYQGMQYPEVQLEMLRQMTVLQHPALWLVLVACWLPILGYLLWSRRFFGRGPGTAP